MECNNYRVGKETFSLRINVRFKGAGKEERREVGKCARISLNRVIKKSMHLMITIPPQLMI
jgi:hypothetical protein